MTADEALALAEAALGDDRLNDVQQFIFRQCWAGRQSYEEIAKLSQYDDEYIRAAAAKLWKLLSEAVGEKVKKSNLQSVLKRYARRNQVTVHREQVIGVNLSGANLSGAKLLISNLSEVDYPRAELGAIISVDNKKQGDTIRPSEQGHNPGSQSTPEGESYSWNGWRFRSEEQLKLAESLDATGVFFAPNFKVRLTTPEGRQNREVDFLICHEGKWGILLIWDEEKAAELELSLFKERGIRIVQPYGATLCGEQPDRVVREFLEILSRAGE